MEIDGFTPEKYARNVARYIYPGNEMNKLVLTDDGKAPKQSVTAGRSAMPLDRVNLIKNCIKTKFDLDGKSSKLSKIWKRCRNSINALGRYNSYKEKENQNYNQLDEQLHALMNQDGHNNILQPIINNNNNENNNNNQN